MRTTIRGLRYLEGIKAIGKITLIIGIIGAVSYVIEPVVAQKDNRTTEEKVQAIKDSTNKTTEIYLKQVSEARTGEDLKPALLYLLRENRATQGAIADNRSTHLLFFDTFEKLMDK